MATPKENVIDSKRPSPATLRARLDADFGDIRNFKQELSVSAIGRFGSGWAWRVLDGKRLRVVKTSNADTRVLERSPCWWLMSGNVRITWTIKIKGQIRWPRCWMDT